MANVPPGIHTIPFLGAATSIDALPMPPALGEPFATLAHEPFSASRCPVAALRGLGDVGGYCPGSVADHEEEAVTVTREGGCACGAVRYRLASEPLFPHCCHCLNCQRQTGSAFVINVLIETDRVELLAEEPLPVDVPRGRSKQRIWRCPTCQVALFSRYTRASVRFVRAGTLDDPSSVTPDVHIYTRSKLGWVTLPESVPAFRTHDDTEALWPPASLERLKSAGRRPRSPS